MASEKEYEGHEGVVYILTNPEMPGLVKIGKTSRDEVEERVAELYSTGVPVRFDCVYAARVHNEDAVERAFHATLEPRRVNPNREFFRIEPGQVKTILEKLALEDVTPNRQMPMVQVPTPTSGHGKLKLEDICDSFTRELSRFMSNSETIPEGQMSMKFTLPLLKE